MKAPCIRPSHISSRAFSFSPHAVITTYGASASYVWYSSAGCAIWLDNGSLLPEIAVDPNGCSLVGMYLSESIIAI